MRTLLRDEGYRVETAIDGLDALQQLGCAPDLILLDLQIPVMDGCRDTTSPCLGSAARLALGLTPLEAEFRAVINDVGT